MRRIGVGWVQIDGGTRAENEESAVPGNEKRRVSQRQ